MITVEHPYDGRDDLIHHSSSTGMKLLQSDTGTLYSDAIDGFPTEHVYEETDIPIEQAEPDNPGD